MHDVDDDDEDCRTDFVLAEDQKCCRCSQSTAAELPSASSVDNGSLLGTWLWQCRYNNSAGEFEISRRRRIGMRFAIQSLPTSAIAFIIEELSACAKFF